MRTSPGAAILVVDDDQDICRNLMDILTEVGYAVDTAHDGPTALELVRRRAYEVALLDYRMPGMDGLTLYREIKALRPSTVAMLVTAYAAGETARQALSAGAWRVLSKPVELPALLELIDAALEEPLVLVVDDDHALCLSLWDVLRERGYRVGLAHDAAGAAAALRDMRYDVVLIDMKLPGGDGRSVYQWIKGSAPATPALLTTGHGAEMKETIEATLAEGASGICYKPLDMDRLLDQLRRLTSERAMGRPGRAGDASA
ncbi:MAG: response regulator [Isosphaeraceae bacterium]|jgi:DNA-binding NtrC family response regulator|nr:MAG: response regulator [Isosphaeraceae bacterium]